MVGDVSDGFAAFMGMIRGREGMTERVRERSETARIHLLNVQARKREST